MTIYRADLHIHTVLSPCGDLEMSPIQIVDQAKQMGLDIIGITDHNSTRQCGVISRYGREQGVYVLSGVEVTTKEEVHCLAFFETEEQLSNFQSFLDLKLPKITNKPELFGYQVAVDLNEQIVYEEERLLISAIDASIEEVNELVLSMEGIFIPAHIDKPSTSLFSQLGFIPKSIRAHAFEYMGRRTRAKMEELGLPNTATLLTNSDAHYLHQIGTRYNMLEMDELSFSKIKKTLKQPSSIKHVGG